MVVSVLVKEIAISTIGAVNVVPADIFQIVQGFLASTEVEVNGLIGLRQLHIVFPRAPNRAYGIDIADVAENAHTAGNATLGQHFVKNVGFADTELGHGFFDVVEHNGYRTAQIRGFQGRAV